MGLLARVLGPKIKQGMPEMEGGTGISKMQSG